MTALGNHLPPDLRKRIEIMAEHIARNGPEFEHTVKTKNANNPQFAFLYAGEGADYYQHKLAENRRARAGAGGSSSSASAAPSSAGTASGGVASSASAAGSAPTGGQASDADLAELVQRWKEPPVYPLSSDAERQLGEVILSLEQLASRDAIRNGRVWIESNASIVQQIAGNVMKRIAFLAKCAHRLHVLYLVHDVLQTEAARKEAARPLIRGFKPFLVWILRPAYQLAKQTDEQSKVLRLVQLWVDRDILTQKEAEEMKALAVASEIPGVARPMVPRPPVMPPRPQGMYPGGPMPPVQHRPPGAPMMVPGIRPGGAWPVPGQAMGGAYTFPGQRPPMVGAQGYRMQLQTMAGNVGKMSPETVPVGVMATIMRQSMRRMREARQDFVPYKPIETAFTPQMLPPMEMPTPRLLERVKDFYEDLQDEERESRSSSSRSRSRSCSSRSSSRSRSRSRSRSASGVRGRAAGIAMNAMMMGGGAASGGFVHNAVPPPLD